MPSINVSDQTKTKLHDKIGTIEEIALVSEHLRKQGKKIVQCHGVFDLLHIGHIRHFEAAKRLGDVLIVTLTPDKYVNKGPHRPAFSEELRAEAIAALEIVDYVAVTKWPRATEAISLIRPAFYAKGSDYKDQKKDRTGGIVLEEQAVQAGGGQLVITEDITFSSTKLINTHLQPHSSETQAYLADFASRYSVQDITTYLEKLQTLSVLVVGETIIDEYQYCEAIGKSSKEPTLAVKLLLKDTFAGGVLAIGNHTAGLTNRVSVVTQLGEENSYKEFIAHALSDKITFLPAVRRGSRTIVKRRYIDEYFFTKLFETYEISDEGYVPAGQARAVQDEEELFFLLKKEVSRHDVVIVADYGHGMLSDRMIQMIGQKAKFLSVNTQSNAGNLGYHTISRYSRMNHVSLAEHEVRLEARDRYGDIKGVMQKITERVNCDTLIVTRGKRGCLCWSKNGEVVEVPALAGKVVDRVGAGDAFLSITGLCLAADVPLEVVGFLGNAAGAQAVASVGNSRSLDQVSLIRHVESLLK